jgi:hypothetical protein
MYPLSTIYKLVLPCADFINYNIVMIHYIPILGDDAPSTFGGEPQLIDVEIMNDNACYPPSGCNNHPTTIIPAACLGHDNVVVVVVNDAEKRALVQCLKNDSFFNLKL